LEKDVKRRPRIVIVGGGFGGLFAAKSLRRADADVLIVDKSNHHLFQPLLYQVATAGLSPANIAAPIRSVLSKQKNVEVMLAEVIGVNAQVKEVLLPDRRVSYDYLILATGARHSYFDHPEWEEHAPGLKSVRDATRIRTKILLAFEQAEMEKDSEAQRAWLNFVIVGAGPTGVELAGSIAELAHRVLTRDFDHINLSKTRVLLLEAAPRILPSFSEKLSKKARASLERLGVEVLEGTRVEDVQPDHVVANGVRIPTRSVLWAAGVQASHAASWLGVEPDRAGRIPVRPNCEVVGHDGVFAIGDTMSLAGEDGKPLPGVCQTAMQQGEFVGRLLMRRIAGRAEPAAFRYRDKGSLATIGRAAAVAQIGRFEFGGFLAWLLWLFVHILYLIGFANRVLVLIQWAWAYLTFQRGARLITERDDMN
jgi:NADH dehydrogenase